MQKLKGSKPLFTAKAVLIAIGALIILAAYYPVFSNQLLTWDDQTYLLDNTMIHRLSAENLKQMLTGFHAANWHPLTWLSHAVDWRFFGAQARGHHTGNLLLHGLNTLWVWVVALALLCRSPLPYWWAAGAAAALFAVHPQHVEVVAWAAERKELLCFFFMLPALLAYYFYTLTSRSTGKVYWFTLSLLCFAAALAAKPMAVTLPAVLLLLDVYPLRRLAWRGLGSRQKLWVNPLCSPDEAQRNPGIPGFRCASSGLQPTEGGKPVPTTSQTLRVLGEKLPYVLLSLAVVWLTLQAQSQGGAVASVQSVALVDRLANAVYTPLFYLSKWLLPIHLSPFYPYQYYPLIFTGVLVLVIVLLLLSAGYFALKRQPVWLTSALFYVITLLPVIGLVQVGSQAAADRYTYWPMLPFYLLAGLGIATLVMQRKRRLAIALLLIIIPGLTWLSARQATLWHDDIRLWDYAVTHTPDSHLAHSNLAGQYILSAQYDKAITHYKISIHYSRKPADYYYLAAAYLKTGRFDAALQTYEAILALQFEFVPQDMATIYVGMAQVYFVKGLHPQAAEAAEHALDLVPGHPVALEVLAHINEF